MLDVVDTPDGYPAGTGIPQLGYRRIVDRERQQVRRRQDFVQDNIDHTAVAEYRNGIGMASLGDDIGQRASNAVAESVRVHRAGEFTGGHSGPVIWSLDAHLLKWYVVRQSAVVFGQPILDVDGEAAGSRHRLGGLKRTALRTAHQPADRKTRQGIGQAARLFPACVRQFRIGTLTGLRSCRQRMADEQKLHACNDRGARTACRQDLQ